MKRSGRSMGVAAAVLGIALSSACSPRTAVGLQTLTIVQTQPVTVVPSGRENGAVAQEMAALLDRYLITVDPAGNLVADAAATVPTQSNGGITADGLTIVYHIKPGLHFSDGSTLDATDVVKTLGALTDKSAILPSRLGLDDVVSVESRGPLEVRVRLRKPFAPILLFLCGPGNATPIVSDAQTAIISEVRADPASVAGAGPYRIRSIVPGERLELEPNPWYSPRPGISQIVLRTVASSETAHLQLHSREASGYVLADSALAPQLADAPGLRVRGTPIDGVGSLIFNTQAPAVAEAAVRRALATAIDFRGSVRRVFDGGVASRGAAAGLFLWAYDRRAFARPLYDPAAAAKAFDALGWRLAPDGKRYRDGKPVELRMIVRSDQPSSGNLAIELAADLRTAGIDVDLRQYAIGPWASPDGPLYTGKFDIAIVQFIAGFDPDLTDQFACDRVPPRGYNKPRYCNPALDAILARAAATYDRSQRIALYRKAEAILSSDLPLLPLYRLVSLNALPVSLDGVSATPVTPFYGVAHWHIAHR